MKNSWFRIVNRSNTKEKSTVYIYDDIGLWGVTAKDFEDAINEVEGDFDLRMATGGGSMFEGIAIYNSIKRHSGKVQVYLDGVVASMGTYIMLAGDSIEIAENGWIMIHNPQGGAVGGSEDLRKVADLMDALKDTILNGYQSATGLDRNELSKMLDETTWMDAETAKEKGFVDTIGAAHEMAASLNRPEKYSNIPDVFNKSKSAVSKTLQGAVTRTQQGDKNMSDIKDKLVALNVVKHTASDSDAESQLQSFVNKANENAVTLDSATAEIEKLKNENQSLKDKANTALLKGFEAQIDSAIESKRVDVKQKDALIKLFKADAVGAEELLATFEPKKAPTNGTQPLGGKNALNRDEIENRDDLLPEEDENGNKLYSNIIRNKRILQAS